MCRIDNSVQMESRLVIFAEGMKEVTAGEYEMIKIFWNWIAVIIAKLQKLKKNTLNHTL